MGIINADELAKSYKLSLLKKIKAGDLHDDDLFQISSIRTNPKYFNTNAIDLDEFTKYIALKIGEHTGVEVTPYHDTGDKVATITVNGVPVDIYAKDLVVDTDYVAEQYDPNKAYSVGDYCMYNDKLYKCTTAISKAYWYKLPQTFNGSGGISIAFSNTNADPEDTYVSITSNGTWVLASNSSGQVVRCSQFSLNDFSLTYSYQNVYYNSDYSNYNPSIVETYFENGGYESVNSALDDLIADRSFDPSKWTEVTVTGEISNVPQLPAVSATDNDKILKVVNGSWDKGSQDVLVIDCGYIRLGVSAYKLNFPNGLTCAQIFNWLHNGTYIIFKVRENDIDYYSNICTTSSAASRFYIRFTDYYDIYQLIHYEYILSENAQTYTSFTRAIRDYYIPRISASDAGKVLTVDSNGHWVAANLPDGSNTEY